MPLKLVAMPAPDHRAFAATALSSTVLAEEVQDRNCSAIPLPGLTIKAQETESITDASVIKLRTAKHHRPQKCAVVGSVV